MAKNKFEQYDPVVADYIMNNYKGVTTNELVVMIKRDLGIDEELRRVRLFTKRYKLRSGVDCTFKKGNISPNKGKKMSAEHYEKCKKTMFKKGNRPHNDRKLGSEYTDHDGYVYIKVKDNIGTKKYERWKSKHHLIWEEHNNKKVPEGHMVIFADGDINNYDPNNLVLVTKRESLYLNQHNLRYNDCELTKTGLLIAKVKIAVKDRSKK